MPALVGGHLLFSLNVDRWRSRNFFLSTAYSLLPTAPPAP